MPGVGRERHSSCWIVPLDRLHKPFECRGLDVFQILRILCVLACNLPGHRPKLTNDFVVVVELHRSGGHWLDGIQYGKLTVMKNRRRIVSPSRLLRILEVPEVKPSPGDRDLRVPLLVADVPRDPLDPRRVASDDSTIAVVLLNCSVAEVVSGAIESIGVLVFDDRNFVTSPALPQPQVEVHVPSVYAGHRVSRRARSGR